MSFQFSYSKYPSSIILVRRYTIEPSLLILLTLNWCLLLLQPAPQLFYYLLPPSCSHAQVVYLNNLLHDLTVPLEFLPTLEYYTFEYFPHSVLPLLAFLPPSLLRLEMKLHLAMTSFNSIMSFQGSLFGFSHHHCHLTRLSTGPRVPFSLLKS